MGELRIGTSGYLYKDWTGPFYPEKTGTGAMLAWYAGRFGAVELNYTYYRMPDARSLARLARQAAAVNESFVFAVKAHRTLTHEISPDWPADADAFREALEGLRPPPAAAGKQETARAKPDGRAAEAGAETEAEAPRRAASAMAAGTAGSAVIAGTAEPLPAGKTRLAAVLAQFPHSFHYTVQNRRHLAALLQKWDGLPVAVEFRNAEWMRERVTSELRSRNVALAGVDCPDIAGLPPRKAWTGTDLGYVRFHGRNRDNWWKGDNASRYDYEYSEAELREWLPRLRDLLAHSRRTLAFFNNHWKGKATKNAAMLQAMVNGAVRAC